MNTRVTGIDYVNNYCVLLQRFPGQVVCGSINQVPLNSLKPFYFQNIELYRQHKTKLNYIRGFQENYRKQASGPFIPTITIKQSLKILWRAVCKRIGLHE